MNRLSLDDPPISKEEFKILREIVESAPNALAAPADLRVVKSAYDIVLRSHGLKPEHDEIYWLALLKLKQCDGETWATKLLSAAAQIDAILKQAQARTERLYRRRKTQSEAGLSRPSQANRSVLQQKLERQEQLSQSDPFLQVPAWRNTQHSFLPRKTETSRPLTREESNALRRFTLSRALHAWKYSTRFRREKELKLWEIAKNKYNERLQHDAREEWRKALSLHEYANEQGLIMFQQCLRQIYYKMWINQTISKREVDHFQELRDARYFSHWRSALRKRQKQSSKALILRNKHTHLTVWHLWVHQMRLILVRQHHNRSFLSRYFLFWRTRFAKNKRMHTEAQDMFSVTLMYGIFDEWRYESSLHEEASLQAVQHDKVRLLIPCLETWRTNFRLSITQRRVTDDHNSRLLRQHFSPWHEETLLTLYGKRVCKQNDRNKTKNEFTKWRNVMLMTVSGQETGSQRWKRNVKLKSFQIMQEKLDRSRISDQNSCEVEQKISNRKAFLLWRDTLRDKQERQREAQLSTLLTAKGARVRGRLLMVWLERHRHLVLAQHTAEEMLQQKQHEQIRDVFYKWHDRLHFIYTLHEQSTEHEHTRSARLIGSKLLQRFAHHTQVEMKLYQMLRERNERCANTKLHEWRVQYLLRLDTNDQIQSDLRQYQRLRKYRKFRNWLNSTRERRRVLGRTLRGDVSGSSASPSPIRPRKLWSRGQVGSPGL